MPSPSRITANSSTISKVNQTAIIDALKAHGPLPKARIGELTGLSPATVNRLTTVLLKERIIVTDGQEPSTGGRPSLVFKYSGRSRAVAGIQLRAEKATGMLIDFDGKVIEHYEVPFDAVAGETPGNEEQQKAFQHMRLEQTLELFDHLLKVGEKNGTPCLSVGVSVPGVVSGEDGIVGRTPELGWPTLALGKILRERTKIPVVLENDANALAFGELRRGAGQGASTLIAVLLGNGLGAGLVTNGMLHRGASSEAGEIGYMLMDRSSLQKSFGDLGDLENRVGAISITKAARQHGLNVPAGTLMTAQDLVTLAAEGNPVAQLMADEILDLIAIAIANMSVLLDPELVVVGTNRAPVPDTVIDGLTARLKGRIIRVPPLVRAELGENAVLVGVAELALDQVSGRTYVAK